MVTTSIMLTPNHSTGHDGRYFIGIHTMEAPETDHTAEAVAHYFMNPSVQASAHWCVDNNSRVRCVHDNDSAWTMPPTNHYSLNIELAGYAAQSKDQWDDKFSDAELDIAAFCSAEWCHKYGIPVRHLDHDQIRRMEKGFVGHRDVNAVFHESTHTDPGPNFPWDRFFEMVRTHLSVIEHTARPPHDLGKPNCVLLQQAVRVTADNKWGKDTDKHCTALIAVTVFGGHRFPYGIKFAQQVVGAAQDNHWGRESYADLAETIAHVQTALRTMGFNPGKSDGSWGPDTNNAYLAARKACHI